MEEDVQVNVGEVLEDLYSQLDKKTRELVEARAYARTYKKKIEELEIELATLRPVEVTEDNGEVPTEAPADSNFDCQQV